jgi:protein-disulfide isomerase
LPQLDREYIQTGKVKYVFRDFPLSSHKQAFKAAEAANCAGEQGKFWQMHARLFENQGALSVENLSRYAQSLDLYRAS